MAKALAEQKSVVSPQPSNVPWGMEPVLEGGPVRRIWFEGEAESPPADRPPIGEAAEAILHERTPEPVLEFHERYHPRHADESLDSIHAEVDRLHRGTAAPTDLFTQSRTLYRTPGGEVREAVVSTPEGRRRHLYVTRMEDGREVETRFSPAVVDRLVADAPLPEDMAPAPTAEPEPPVAEETGPKRGLFGFLRRGRAAEQDYIPVEPGTPEAPPALAPLALAEETPAWTPPRSEVVFASDAPAPHRTRPKPARKPAHKPVRKAAKPRRPKAARKPVKAARKPKARRRTPAPYVDYKGDQHLVIELEGIGPTYAKRLHGHGVYTTDRLCYENAARLARKVKAPVKTVKTWRSMAELVKVRGIGPQFAEALTRAGVDGIDGLKAATPKVISDKVTRYLAGLETNVLGTGVTVKRVQAWQRTAKRMRKVRQSVPATTPPEATTWYEKARQDAATKELKAGLRQKRAPRRKTGKGRRKK